jgi:hypothetical protein
MQVTEYAAEFSEFFSDFCKLRDKSEWQRMRNTIGKMYNAGLTRGRVWRLARSGRADSPNKWVSYASFSLLLLSDVIRLLGFLLVPLAQVRSTVLMALLTYKLAEERQTDGRTDAKRQRTRSETNREAEKARRIILPARTRRIMGRG